MEERKRLRGFARLSSEEQRKIAERGGRAVQAKGTGHQFTSAEAGAAGHKGAGIPRPRKAPGVRISRQETEAFRELVSNLSDLELEALLHNRRRHQWRWKEIQVFRDEYEERGLVFPKLFGWQAR